MSTSHKITRMLVALVALIVLSLAALAGNPPQNIGVSDQKAGGLLVYPYYTNKGQSNTRISMTNVGIQKETVHILLMDGSTCQQLDYFACITPNGSLVDYASNFDPTNAGYIIAFPVDVNGNPNGDNALIGNAFVNDGDFVGNYGAEAFWFGPDIPILALAGLGGTEAIMVFNVPTEFAVEIQSPLDAVQRIVLAGLVGNANTNTVKGTGQVGSAQAFNAQEKAVSFSAFIGDACWKSADITATSPRVPGTLAGLIAKGNSGHLRFSVGGAVGLLMTSNKSTSGVSGIRTLHKTAIAPKALTVPVFMPSC